MRMAIRGVAMVAALMMTFGVVSGAAGKRTLKGSFEWTDGGNRGDLEAVFTPAGEGKWDVAFHFEFRGTPHIYAGSAEGTLAGGALKGRVHTEDRNRTFSFTGTFSEGKFQGTHAEIVDDGEHATGTLTLKG